MDKKNPKERIIRAMNDEDLGKVTGGREEQDGLDPRLCPLCHMMKDNEGICQNLGCTNYGSYC